MTGVVTWTLLGLLALLLLTRRSAGGSVLPSWAYTGSSVQRIAEAIAFAEGFSVSGSLADLNNNPGNIRRLDGSFYAFSTESEGWMLLYDYVSRMIAGQHAAYPPGVTIYQASRIYTATEQDAWARNVAGYLGVSIDTRLEDV